MQLIKGTLNHLTEARLLLEPGLCRLAAERATAQDLARLETVVKQQEVAVKTGKDTTSYDLKFHRILIDAARNPILGLTTVSVIDLLVNALQEARVGAGLTAHVVNFHRAIYNALCERDGEKAARLMADHVADIQRRLQPHLIRGRSPAAPRQWISAPLRLDETTWDK
jgi:GntR family transcriptional repressor for pyruvate dehydrogenase complex